MRYLALSTFILLAACASTAGHSVNTLSVSELRQIIDARTAEGDVVVVSGFISDSCYIRGCSLVAVASDHEATRVSLAGGTPVEDSLRSRAGHPVMLRGQINRPRTYTTDEGQLVVTSDRASEFIPIEIIN